MTYTLGEIYASIEVAKVHPELAPHRGHGGLKYAGIVHSHRAWECTGCCDTVFTSIQGAS